MTTTKKENKRVMITLSNEIFGELEKLAKERGLSKSALITMWVNQEKKA